MRPIFNEQAIQNQIEIISKDYQQKAYMSANGEMVMRYEPRWIGMIEEYCKFLQITPMQLLEHYIDLTKKKENEAQKS